MTSNNAFNLAEFHKVFNNNILILYKGPFDKHILSVYSSYIESIIQRFPALSKKVYSIFVELAQNIAYYSAEKHKGKDHRNIGIGTLVISESEKEFIFFSGNEVSSENLKKVINRCEIINSLDKDGLRKFRREQLNLPVGDHDTAHIGLIQVALTTSNSLKVEVTKLENNNSFFSLQAVIQK